MRKNIFHFQKLFKLEVLKILKKQKVQKLFCQIRFIDSFKFMADSLENLTNYLTKSFSFEDLVKNIPRNLNEEDILKYLKKTI